MACMFSLVTMVLLLLCGALLFVPVMKLFKVYCEMVARLENRLEEFQSIQRDDGGLNRFERENLTQLLTGRYERYSGHDVHRVGKQIRRYLILAYAAGLVYLGASIYIGTNVCTA